MFVHDYDCILWGYRLHYTVLYRIDYVLLKNFDESNGKERWNIFSQMQVIFVPFRSSNSVLPGSGMSTCACT